MDWIVIYTKPKNEKKVQEQLSIMGHEAYCPCQRKLKQWSDRKKWVQEPIFKSYVFIQPPQSELKKKEILQLHGVVRFLYWLGKPAKVKQTEIDAIKTFVAGYNNIQVHSFNKGITIQVKDGLLKGSKGVVMYQTKNEVILRIDQLGMSLSAKISKTYIEPLRL
tara:strand:- start:4015 stop:4506 length:492 start_codon:yes stop_codon:yes gene_type:complete